MVIVKNLTKRYGANLAVHDVSFRVGKGEVVGFLGPNGAGKSTTLRILAGFLGMTSGDVTIAGHDIVEDSFEARKHMGYMPEAVPLYPEMRVIEYLRFRAELKRVPRKLRASQIDDAMQKANVTDVATQVIGKLSKGYRQRVGLADALVGRPPILILDEPTAGLDPNQIREVRAVVKELGKDHTIVLSTHILSEVEASCTRVILIARGKIVAEGPIDHIRKLQRPTSMDVTVRGDAAKAVALLKQIVGVRKVAREGEPPREEDPVTTLRCEWTKKLSETDAARATEDAVAKLVGAGLGVREVKPVGGSLEDVFASLTRGDGDRDGKDESDGSEARPEPDA